MLGFFRNIFKKVKSTLNQEKYARSYEELVNIFRRVTPLEIQDIDNIQTLLKAVVEDTSILDKKMRILKNAMRNKALIKTRYNQFIKDEFRKLSRHEVNCDRDVTYCVGDTIVYGDVKSDEEDRYFSMEHVDSLNKMPFKPKKCEFDRHTGECQACVERRIRLELSKKIELESEYLSNEKVKKRKISVKNQRNLEEKLGIPMLFKRYVLDDDFKIEELDEEEQKMFLKWKDDQKKGADVARKALSMPRVLNTIEESACNIIDTKKQEKNIYKDNMKGYLETADSFIPRANDVNIGDNLSVDQVFTDITHDEPANNSYQSSFLEPIKKGEIKNPKLEDLVKQRATSAIQEQFKNETADNSEFTRSFKNPFEATGFNSKNNSIFQSTKDNEGNLENPFEATGFNSKNNSIFQSTKDNEGNLENPFEATGFNSKNNSIFQSTKDNEGNLENPFEATGFNSKNNSIFQSTKDNEGNLENPFAKIMNPFSVNVSKVEQESKTPISGANLKAEATPQFEIPASQKNELKNPFSIFMPKIPETSNPFTAPSTQQNDFSMENRPTQIQPISNPFLKLSENPLLATNCNSFQQDTSNSINRLPTFNNQAAALNSFFVSDTNSSGQANPFFQQGDMPSVTNFSNQNIFQRGDKEEDKLFSAEGNVDGDNTSRRRKAFRKR
ncbi:hypothetical protein GINT2_001521 [Glugoides intestinalis]